MLFLKKEWKLILTRSNPLWIGLPQMMYMISYPLWAYQDTIGGSYRFSKICFPITSLQKKGVKFIWTSECEERFQEMKYLLTNAPMLKIADPNKELLVCTDSCKEGLGGFLMQ
jgi:hypothetical protein